MTIIPAMWEAETEGSKLEASAGKGYQDSISKTSWAHGRGEAGKLRIKAVRRTV
jgi:hypothetical protein